MVRPSTLAAALSALLLALSNPASAWPRLSRRLNPPPPDVPLAKMFRVPFLEIEKVVLDRKVLTPDPKTKIGYSNLYDPDPFNWPKLPDEFRDLKGIDIDIDIDIDRFAYGLARRGEAASDARKRDENVHPMRRLRIDPSDRESLPYSAVGKLLIKRPNNMHWECTASLIKEDIILTADHCLPWDIKSINDWITIEFIPAYDGSQPNSRPYNSAFVTRCAGADEYKHDGRDMAACQLNSSIGAQAGVFQVGYPDRGSAEGVVNAFFHNTYWFSVGYPGASGGGQVPVEEEFVDIKSVTLGLEGGMTLTSQYYTDGQATEDGIKGWSGGPLYGWVNDNDPAFPKCPPGFNKTCPFIGGVVTGQVSSGGTWSSTVHVGGYRMAVLAAYGRLEFVDIEHIGTSPGYFDHTV